MRPFVLTILLGVASLACEREAPEIDGYGSFHIGRTTLADGYVCTPDGDLTFCSNNPSPALAGHQTTTDLYFRGSADDAPLVEILVAVRACDESKVQAALREKLGAPTKAEGATRVWTQKSAIVVARLPAEPGVCEISFVAPDETERLRQLGA